MISDERFMKDKKQTAIETEEVEVVKKQSKASKVFSTIINVVLVLAIVLAAISTYVSFVTTSGNGIPSIFGFQMYSIQTSFSTQLLKSPKTFRLVILSLIGQLSTAKEFSTHIKFTRFMTVADILYSKPKVKPTQ